ncbi:hypothetical protein PISL3812_05556 [Talaromyces islandicus]|uniref:Uncharacterized protein n=1 Tax=Talaromyces islandicus TaxID=28573 RepID=A0A0U1LYX5_TALIS|nr:hypothetical protein PISL3812_05556 [Talaromyces islandicus]
MTSSQQSGPLFDNAELTRNFTAEAEVLRNSRFAGKLKTLSNSHRKFENGTTSPEAMVSIVGFGATLLAIGQLWFSWTCPQNVHWIVPILACIPFGAGNACVFICSSNYIARSYGIYAASALAGNMLLQSIIRACLPLAGPSTYATLATPAKHQGCGTLLRYLGNRY